MAVERPWVSPKDVKEYTDHKDVSERADAKLLFDISRAELKVIHMTNNKFENYEKIPENAKMAIILLAEAYAKNAIENAKKNIKSESFDDYSYTVESSLIDIDDIDLEGLLDEYTIAKGSGKIVMNLRSL